MPTIYIYIYMSPRRPGFIFYFNNIIRFSFRTCARRSGSIYDIIMYLYTHADGISFLSLFIVIIIFFLRRLLANTRPINPPSEIVRRSPRADADTTTMSFSAVVVVVISYIVGVGRCTRQCRSG